ncbi:hypothetical protein HPA02_34540 [Bisbaumannia pacifica]|uniref:Uncharacterized protein n=1 Tax=Bisbaumannia pacifica TaxID=77098 RepID=A0A510XDP9_9GAMM|nr:hypothetical protein [Halomonas pacifica]GEK49171.1 hypothetical protein HPA02_34540 [Halomonas pacifica]
MAGNKAIQREFQDTRPRTYIALQKLVIAMAKVVPSQGKRTWLGRDKGVAALQTFFDRLSDTITAMHLEGRIHPDEDSLCIQAAIDCELIDFEKAHPNWQDAYHFFAFFTDPDDPTFDSEAVIQRARRF